MLDKRIPHACGVRCHSEYRILRSRQYSPRVWEWECSAITFGVRTRLEHDGRRKTPLLPYTKSIPSVGKGEIQACFGMIQTILAILCH